MKPAKDISGRTIPLSHPRIDPNIPAIEGICNTTLQLSETSEAFPVLELDHTDAATHKSKLPHFGYLVLALSTPGPCNKVP